MVDWVIVLNQIIIFGSIFSLFIVFLIYRYMSGMQRSSLGIDIPPNAVRIKNFMSNRTDGYFEGVFAGEIRGYNNGRRGIYFQPTDVYFSGKDLAIEQKPDVQYIIVEDARVIPLMKISKRPQLWLLPKRISEISYNIEDETMKKMLYAVMSEADIEVTTSQVLEEKDRRIKSILIDRALGESTKMDRMLEREMWQKHYDAQNETIKNLSKKGTRNIRKGDE